VVSFQWSVVSFQFSVFGFRFSVFGGQFSVFGVRLAVFGWQWVMAVCLPAAVPSGPLVGGGGERMVVYGFSF
jgi:hypothetical protein